MENALHRIAAPRWRLAPGLATLRALLRRWHRRRATRAHLNDLAPHLLADIGLDERARARECARPFWR
jgi:uncharacterized protein YjiS (DUF1127 family)